MAHATRATLTAALRNEATASPPAGHAPDLARQLFEEEVAVLEAQATVKTFIDVIATRRVRQRLRELDKASPAHPQFDGGS